LVQDLTVRDAPAYGVRVEASDDVVVRKARVTWTTPKDTSNGGYGVSAVRSQHVLVEDSRAANASLAGFHVSEGQHVILRNNVATGNVAGIEIKNTQYGDIVGNTAETNAGGIVVLDLPGVSLVGRDVRVRNNHIRKNNLANFAPSGSGQTVPAGTGTFVVASRRLEITNNIYESNDTADVFLLSGLLMDSNSTAWERPTASIVGTWQDLDLLPGSTEGTVATFRTENIAIAGNGHSGSGLKPAAVDPLNLGVLLALAYGAGAADNVLYDTSGEPQFHSTDPGQNSNANHICIGANTSATFASTALAMQSTEALIPFFRPAAPFAPFDCTVLTGGPVADVMLP
jgi:parallel beta-helix repeat protein